MKEQQYKALRIVRSHGFPQVEKVVDATRPAVVEVTASDNKNAVALHHNQCAFALACVRDLRADGVIIGMTTSYIIKGKTAIRYRNTETLGREITSFDRKAGFDIGFYHLSPCSPSNAMGKSHQARSGRSGKSYNKMGHYRHYTKNVRATLR
jgi:hypothetical protein